MFIANSQISSTDSSHVQTVERQRSDRRLMPWRWWITSRAGPQKEQPIKREEKYSSAPRKPYILCCCPPTDDDEDKPIFKKNNERHCTDVCCCLLLFFMIVVMVVIAVYSLIHGDIKRIIYPTDYLGQFCGLTPGVTDLTNCFFPRLEKDIQTFLPLFLSSPYAIVSFRPYTLCVQECPRAFSLANPQAFGGPSRAFLR